MNICLKKSQNVKDEQQHIKLQVLKDQQIYKNSEVAEKTFNNCIQRPTSGTIVINRNKSPVKKVKKIGQLKRKSGEPSRKSREISDSNKSAYYRTPFISNPCEQLFGPQVVEANVEIHESTKNESIDEPIKTAVEDSVVVTTPIDEYIPAPKWTKIQIVLLEELYRKGRFPKTSEIKQTAQKLKVMDSDVEEWFRKRRGRDRKIRRKNDNLKSMIDNYLDH